MIAARLGHQLKHFLALPSTHPFLSLQWVGPSPRFKWILEVVSSDGTTVLSASISLTHDSGYEILNDPDGIAIRALPKSIQLAHS
jgi:hypothetical protein